MNETKSVKSLKKQLAAAIAMVTVAAVALGSSTYAWFVNSNKVDATTNNISAQSNSAYLVIANAKDGKTSENSTTSAVASEKENTTTALYPAQWANHFNTDGSKVDSNGTYQFETAYAKEKSEATENDGTRFVVGTPAQAVDKEYALLNTFYIGTGTYDGEFNNLKVSNMTVTATEDVSLKTAMRLLVMTYAPNDNGGYSDTPTGWAVVKTDGSTMSIENQSGTEGVIYTSTFGKSEGDVKVEVYVYYDGSDKQVFTVQLDKLTSCGAQIFFEATATSK